MAHGEGTYYNEWRVRNEGAKITATYGDGTIDFEGQQFFTDEKKAIRNARLRHVAEQGKKEIYVSRLHQTTDGVWTHRFVKIFRSK